MTLEATYTDHGFKIASGQYQGETKVENEDGTMTTTLYIYSGIASGYYSYWFPEQSVNLAPTMINGEIVLTLQDNGSAEGDTIADLLLGFFLEKTIYHKILLCHPLPWTFTILNYSDN